MVKCLSLKSEIGGCETLLCFEIMGDNLSMLQFPLVQKGKKIIVHLIELLKGLRKNVWKHSTVSHRMNSEMTVNIILNHSKAEECLGCRRWTTCIRPVESSEFCLPLEEGSLID